MNHPYTQRISFLGLYVDALTMQQSVDSAISLAMQRDKPHQHVVVNAAKVVAAQRDPKLRRIINECSIVNADGMSVVWAARILGMHVPERVAGIDFMQELWRSAAKSGMSIYLLGARCDVVETVAYKAAAVGVHVAGYRDGYWLPEEEEDVVSDIATSGADILFIAIPSPAKEKFLAKYLPAAGVGLAVGVGGSFDVVAGTVRRAPQLMRRIGLEWAYRLIQEPTRMWRRYLVGNTRFVALVFRQFWIERITKR